MSNNMTTADRALTTYTTLVAIDETSALAWRGAAIALWAASHDVAGDRRTFMRDRANEAHARADQAHRTARGGRQ